MSLAMIMMTTSRSTRIPLPMLSLLPAIILTCLLVHVHVRPVRSFATPAARLTPSRSTCCTKTCHDPRSYRYPAHLEAAASGKDNLALAGKISPFLSKFAIDGKKASKIGSAVSKSCNIIDLATIVIVGWCLEPSVRFIYEKFIEPWRKKDFDKTYLFYAWQLVSEAAKIAAIVYAADVVDIALTAMGMQFAKEHAFGDVTASVIYTAWIGRKLSNAKKKYLRYAIKKASGGNKTGKFFLYNRIADVLITIGTVLRIADALKISKGNVFSKFFALGGVGTVVLSLAAKGIATEFICGLGEIYK